MDPTTPTPTRPREVSESSHDVDERRVEQRRKWRESVSAAFLTDPISQFTIPKAMREQSTELEAEADKLDAAIAELSITSLETVGNEELKTYLYVISREKITNDATKCLKRSRSLVRDLKSSGTWNQGEAERGMKELEETEQALLKERAALASNTSRLIHGMLSHTTHSRIGEAYLASIEESFPERAGVRLSTQGPRDKGQESYARARFLKAYNPPPSDPNDPGYWCPISKQMHDARLVKAAHIIPYGIGEENANYLFGLSPGRGYEAIWSTQNGLVLYIGLEEAFDAGRFVIVPDADGELKVVVLDETILDKRVMYKGLFFRDIHNQRLEFRTDARPGRRYLYLHCLFSLFRRTRYNVEGWEMDWSKMIRRRVWDKRISGIVWDTTATWVRRSIILALAQEIGDIDNLEDIVGEKIGLANVPLVVDVNKEARIAVVIRAAIEGEREEDAED